MTTLDDLPAELDDLHRDPELLDPPRSTAVRTLGDFLYPEPAPRSVPGIFGWWERRRLPYNAIVGAAGLFSTAYLAVISSIPPGAPEGGPILIPLGAILAVGFAANVLYLLGPIVESAILKLFGRSVLPIGPALYRMGLTFSVGLMLLPTIIWTVLWVVGALGFDP